MRVLITRPVSPSETSIVAGDVAYVKSFYRGGRHASLLERSVSRCGELSGSSNNTRPPPSPYEDGDAFPNHLLCNDFNDRGGTTRRGGMENNFLSVRADFMLFVRSADHASQLRREIDTISLSFNETATNCDRLQHEVEVNIVDVSYNPKKVYNWIHHVHPARLKGYDYVWFVDGDIPLSKLNWQAYFHQVRVMRPKICAASLIGGSPTSKPGTEWTTLRYQADPRLLAGEVTISELGYTMLESGVWLRYRALVANESDVMDDLALGGENCFDSGWCHMAKNGMKGKQERGPIWDYSIGYRENSTGWVEMDDVANHDAISGRSCVVFYQTPLQHVSKRSLHTDETRVEATKRLCGFFRGQKGVTGAGGLWTMYGVFVAPKRWLLE